MVSLIEYPDKRDWTQLMMRAGQNNYELKGHVEEILKDVLENGDKALREYAERFDGVKIDNLLVSEQEFAEADSLIPAKLKDAIQMAAKNISTFHKAEIMEEVNIETMPGIRCIQRAVAIGKIGLYIPGGNSPLFSTVLMLGIPAKIAGCNKVILCTPPNKQGKIHPAILYAAKVAGIHEVYKCGGAQAIGAMAYGTETVPKVYKIFGPGNRYVMEAKQQVSVQDVAIDMPAGPSEVMVIADAKANLEFVASDFLSQSEHGPDSQSILLTTDKSIAEELPKVIEKILLTLPRQEMMRKSLSISKVILLKDEADIWKFANDYAPEHLIINCENAPSMMNKVENAGSVFLGQYSPESAGDYASGTNHTLPTSGYAKAYNGVNLDSFIKKITFQELTPEGLNSIGETVEIMAENEDLLAHKLAITLRLKEYRKR